MLLRKLIGYDIFISYSRADKVYAKKLKEQLSSMDYSCFVDYEKVFPGERLSGALKRAIRWSSVFVLVGTENSRNSKYVAQEVDEFLKTRRATVPIFLGGALAKSEWAVIHDNDLVWVDEPNADAPSPVVFDEINRLFKYNRVKVWRRTAGTALTLVLLGLSVFATLQAREARRQQALAEQKTAELVVKQKELEDSTVRLTRQQELLKKQNEDLDKGRVELEKKTSELEGKTKEAETNAEKARRQEQLARRQEALARRNAERAKEQEQIANERQRVALSRELASNAVAQLQFDPELSLMLAAEAIGVDPNAQSEVALRRSLAESRLRGIARDVNGSALSPDGRLLATAHSHYGGFPGGDDVVRVQEAGTGRAVAELRSDKKFMSHPVFSPDGRLFAATCGREVCIFEVGTWRVLTELPGRTDQITSIRFSHDSRLVLTGGYGKTARVWEAATGRAVAALGPLKEAVKDAQFSPDDRLFLAMTETEVVVAKADSGQSLAVLREAQDKSVTPSLTPSPEDASGVPPDVRGRALIVANRVDVAPDEVSPKSNDKRILSSAWSPDGRYVMTLTFGPKSTNVSFWRASDAGEWQPSSELPPEYAKDGKLSPEGRLLLAETENDAFVWVAKAEGKAAADYGGVNTTSPALSPDGRLVATGNYDGSVSLWTYYGSLLAVMRGHAGSTAQVGFSKDGRWIVSTGSDKDVRLWDTGQGGARSVLSGHGAKEVRHSEPSPDGKVLVTAVDDNKIRIWEVSTGRELHVINSDGNAYPGMLVFSPDGKRFLTVDGKYVAHVWDAGSGRSVADLKRSEKPAAGMFSDDFVSKAAFSPDGKMVLTVYGGGDAAVWDTATGKVLFRPSDPLAEDNKPRETDSAGRTVLGPPSMIGVVLAAFSPDGGRLVTVHNFYMGRILRVWDARTWRKLYTLRPDKREDKGGYFGDTKEVSFSPDNRLVVTADENNGETRVWDVRAGRSVAELSLPGGKKIKRARFGADGSFLLTLGEGSADHKWELRRWDVAAWRSFVIAEFDAYLEQLSPDWKFAVHMNNLGVYEVLELSTGLPLAELRGHAGRLNSVRFSPDGKLILTAGSDGTARIYPCELCGSSQDLLGMARHRLGLTGREFTKEERLKYLQGLPQDAAAVTAPKPRAN